MKSNNNLALITGTAHRTLAHKIAACLNTTLLETTVDSFLDGEARIEGVANTRGMDVFIIQPTNQPDRNQTEIELLTDSVLRSAERVTAVIPYLGYARQDRRGESRVPVSIKVRIRNLVSTGLDRLVFLNLHNPVIPAMAEMVDPKIKVDHLNARPVILEWLIKRGLENVTLASTDAGGAKLVASFVKRLGDLKGKDDLGNCVDVELGIGHKTGSSSIGVDKINLIGEFEGRDVYFIDDMTSSGETLINAAEAAQKKNAASITGIVIHPVLANEDVCRALNDSPIDHLVTTDSLPINEKAREIFGEKLEQISIAKLLALGIWHLHHDISITKLFELNGYQDSIQAMEVKIRC